MRFLLLCLYLATFVFGATISKEHHFVGKINDMKLHDGILYVAGEGGLLALDNSMHKVFINQTLMNIGKLKLINIDADSKDEIFISNELSYALIDDNGTELGRFDAAMSSSRQLPIDIYNNNKELNIAVSEDSSYTGDSDNLAYKKYDPSNNWSKFSNIWSIPLDNNTYIANDGIKFRDGKLYSLQYNSESSHIYEHSLIDGSILRDFNTTSGMTIFEVDSQKDLLIIGATQINDNNTINKISFLKLSDFKPISDEILNTPAKMIKTFGNYIAIVANNRVWLSDPTLNSVYLYEYKDGNIKKLFEFNTKLKEVKSLVFEEKSGNTDILFGAGTELYKLDMQGNVLQHMDLNNNLNIPYYNSINAIALGNFGSTNQVVGALDICATYENNTSKMLYYNGLLLDRLGLVNIDSDKALEMWTGNRYRTYVYDDDKTLLFMLPYGAISIEAADLDNDGINELVVLGNGKLSAYNSSGKPVFDLNTTDQIMNFDIKDIDGDNVQDIAYIAYGGNGDVIKIVNGSDATVKYKATLLESATNIHLFKYVFNPTDGKYAIVFNTGGTYRIDINENMGDYAEKYIGDNGFVDEYYNTSTIANMDDDPEPELIRAVDGNISVYDIFFKNSDEFGQATRVPIKTFPVDIGDNEIRGISLYDGDIIVAADKILARYGFDGTKKWQYGKQIDNLGLEDNHFTHIKIAHTTNGNDKIFVSGYSLYEFDTNGNFISKIKGSQSYMFPSDGTYANPFAINSDGTIALGQMGVFIVDAGILVPPPSVEMMIKQGWNLVTLPVDTALNTPTAIANAFPNASYIWKYTDDGWQFFSPNAQLQTVAQNKGYTLFSAISTGEGFWVYNNQNEMLNFSGNSYDITQKAIFTDASSAWSLLGIGENSKSPGAILGAKPNAKLIWNYTDDWNVYTNDETMYHELEGNSFPFIKSLSRGEGFWMYQANQ